MKKIVGKIHIYKVLPPYKNWYSIMTDDGLNHSCWQKAIIESRFSINYHGAI